MGRGVSLYVGLDVGLGVGLGVGLDVFIVSLRRKRRAPFIVSRRKSSKEEKIVGGFTLPSQRNNEPNEAKLVHISVTLSAAFLPRAP